MLAGGSPGLYRQNTNFQEWDMITALLSAWYYCCNPLILKQSLTK